jgi:hypothetical protein
MCFGKWVIFGWILSCLMTGRYAGLPDYKGDFDFKNGNLSWKNNLKKMLY